MGDFSKREQFRRWARTRPNTVRVLAAKLKPWHRYVIKKTGQQCTLRSFCEDGTVTVVTSFRQVGMFDYVVFGLRPDDLERAPHGGGER